MNKEWRLLVAVSWLLFSSFAAAVDYEFETPRGPEGVKWPSAPDLSQYTADSLLKKRGQVCEGEANSSRSSVVRMLSLIELYGLTDDRLIDTWIQIQKRNPLVLSLGSGCFNLNTLASNHPNVVIKNTDGSFTSRLPVVLLKEAVLVLEKDTLKLSVNNGAFLSNSGKFIAIDSNIWGWNEETNKPSYFEKREHFRPFYIAWGGSDTWMLRSNISYLGYQQLKSYGVSFSQYGVRIKGEKYPGGWLLDCEFENNYFGIYTWEAQDLVVLRSKFSDSIVYGIDPHDYSHHLTIAYNEVSGTRERHGLIFSRGVVDSYVIGNYLHNNGGSGLVMDRQASRNFIAGNVVSANNGDGFSFYESPDNFTINNVMQGNKRHGFLIRNSANTYSLNDTIQANGRAGMYVFTKKLDDPTRDYVLDDYVQRVSLAAFNTKLHDNKTGVFLTGGNLEWMEIVNPDIKGPASPLFRGSVNYLEHALTRKIFADSRKMRIKKLDDVGAE
ncbi:MAG: right-handed parallel beta-helix repeat-containing protein [Granulosicoccus sp.]|nr:right-handed parallel beta-helix repeat-containing protein [Granulosicoccus sp.]